MIAFWNVVAIIVSIVVSIVTVLTNLFGRFAKPYCDIKWTKNVCDKQFDVAFIITNRALSVPISLTQVKMRYGWRKYSRCNMYRDMMTSDSITHNGELFSTNPPINIPIGESREFVTTFKYNEKKNIDFNRRYKFIFYNGGRKVSHRFRLSDFELCDRETVNMSNYHS